MTIAKQNHLPEKITQAGTQVAVAAERAKEQINHLVEDTMDSLKRTARQTRHAAEDLMDETTYRIKREPGRAVAIVFGLAFGLGTLTGLLISKRTHQKSCE